MSRSRGAVILFMLTDFLIQRMDAINQQWTFPQETITDKSCCPVGYRLEKAPHPGVNMVIQRLTSRVTLFVILSSNTVKRNYSFDSIVF